MEFIEFDYFFFSSSIKLSNLRMEPQSQLKSPVTFFFFLQRVRGHSCFIKSLAKLCSEPDQSKQLWTNHVKSQFMFHSDVLQAKLLRPICVCWDLEQGAAVINLRVESEYLEIH